MTNFIHRYEPSDTDSDLTILALHGTGADENDLLDFVHMVAPQAAYLSPRGRSQDEGINRYFKRFAEGVFDVEDIKFRAKELAEWIEWAKKEYGVKRLIALGYSNGANIGVALTFAQPDLLDGLVALRAMTPYVPEGVDLTGKPILILSGETDPIMPTEDVNRLAEIFRKAGADVRHEWLATGHGLTPQDIGIARDWLA